MRDSVRNQVRDRVGDKLGDKRETRWDIWQRREEHDTTPCS